MTSKVEQIFSDLRKLPIIAAALGRLKNELPKVLKYHVAEHTDDVMKEALTFAIHDNLLPRDLELLAIAAVFHDIGFVYNIQENEALAAQTAKEAMVAAKSYGEQEIECVAQMIMSTQVRKTPEGPRQVASNELSKYLLDADVSNLGREDFFDKAELVRKEIQFASREIFYAGLIGFMLAHQWYSKAAKAMRQAKKDDNFRQLQELIASGKFP